MATITTDLICNLNQPVEATFLHGNLFSQDNAGNTINVYVLDNGAPATIGGTVSANVIRADGNTVAVSGAIDGNKAYVILPQACYAVPGRVEIIIKLTQNTTITTIAAIVANVYRSTTDTVVDPGTIIPSISSLIAQIEAAVDSIPVDYSGLLATLAADYSSSKTYKVGDYAWQGGVLKRCIVPITTAETYTAAHWTNAILGDDVSALKSAIEADEDAIAQMIFQQAKDRQIFDVDTMIPSTPYQLTVNSSSVYAENSGWRLYPIEINGTAGETYTFNIVSNSSGDVQNYNSCGFYAGNALPVAGASVQQKGTASGANKRGTITLTNNSKYLIIAIQASISSYPVSPFTEACDAIMGHIVVRRGGYTNTNYYEYELEYVYKVVPIYQGSDNSGKILKVGNDGRIELANESSSGGDVPNNAVGYFDTLAVNVDATMLTSDITLGTGWSGDLANGFSHASGNTAALVFNVATEQGEGYIIDFDTSSQSESALYVSIGDEPLVDCYNGTTHIRVGIISDGGYLKITPSSTFASTITNLTCRKVIAEGGTELTQYVRNIKDIGLAMNLTGFWDIAIGGENTLKNNQNGSRNVGIGYMALRDLKTGTRNIAIGTFAMSYIQQGDRNIAIGADTLYDTKTLASRKATDNVAIGKSALQSGTDVKENVAIGTNAMGITGETANGNVAVGHMAAYRCGNNNVAVGSKAHYFGTGSNNVAVGYNSGADQSTPSISTSIAIGYQAKNTKSNQMVLGSANVTEVVMCGNKKINFNQDGSVTWEEVT